MYSTYIDNVLTGPHCPVTIPDDDEPIQEVKPKKVPKLKNQFSYQFKQVRPFVLDRDNYTCQKCGSKRYLEVNHIVHREHGGSNDMSNLITLCDVCHAEEHKGEPIYKVMIKAIDKRRNSNG
jgi:5-methylcytosine-specific restriction endonuclease McrA